MIFLSNSYKDFNSDRLKSEVLRVPRSKATIRPGYANQRAVPFEYDGFDRRVRILEKTYSGTIWITDSDNVFIWDGSEILQKRDSTGSTVVRSYFVNGFEEDGLDYYYTKDHLGSIREVVAADGTTIHAVYDYLPWGEVTKIGYSSVASDFLYTGVVEWRMGRMGSVQCSMIVRSLAADSINVSVLELVSISSGSNRPVCARASLGARALSFKLKAASSFSQATS